ncbi:polysaccharide deacetylase family protein [Thermoactinomyces sp. CICC 10521]|uniref:Polysaccharide deacetylase family protein n=2 Tax=Thermoactinomycetaceae TaxID=186824 RepID=A0A7W1XBF7_9BACL|nr:polysaccharide deacetylase family protein [Thermoactinomyces daqus]MBH8599106.1 polysaccharide deacetylase family protein [Thermoactinomyces sp. CICC 10523]MBH8605745.1 polysaccharide deacetylase family protein [Thermoactinomyces sp. CICC 10522]MBH8607962.1 polysaccharide deacetylase family protein [Thermoactinomyces sp. CICC 10521]
MSLFLSGCTTDQADQVHNEQQKHPSSAETNHPQDQKQYASGSKQNADQQKPSKPAVTNPIPKYEFTPVNPDTLDQKQSEDLARLKDQSVIFNSSRKIKKVALTFDDGPDDQYTPQILDILKEENVHATFFVVGKMAHKNPQMLKRIVSEGHIIGNHTWDHPLIPKLTQKQLESELERADQEIYKIIGYKVHFFRPPYEAIHGGKEQILAKGYQIIDWDVDTEDWKAGRTPEGIYQTIVKEVQPGSIILEHCAGGDRSATVKSLRKTIQYLKNQGYEIVTLDQLLQIPAYENTPTKENTPPADGRV